MWADFPLLPEPASTVAGSVDALYLFLFATSLFMSALIFLLVFSFALKYRRRSESEVPRPIIGSLGLELFWSITPGIICMMMFGWGAGLYFLNAKPPEGTLEIYVVAKQWMWKLQHPEGQREINELHVLVGAPVKLTMTSEDVIHSFYVPAFRIKMDVLPGRYTSMWFQPTKIGRYHLFCAEYCGTKHSAMGGWIWVMGPVEYESWLGGGAVGESMAVAGERLFQRLGCATCHRPDAAGRGPALAGVFGRPVELEGGQTVMADEAYLRESILIPGAKIVAGYKPVMPTFQGQINEEGLLQIIAYIKSLGGERKRTER